MVLVWIKIKNEYFCFVFQVGIPFPDGRHKVSRHALMEMNVAQLQVIVNDLHTQIESIYVFSYVLKFLVSFLTLTLDF